MASGVPRRQAEWTGAYRSDSLQEHNLWLVTNRSVT